MQYASFAILPRSLVIKTNKYLGLKIFLGHPIHQHAKTGHFTTVFSVTFEIP